MAGRGILARLTSARPADPIGDMESIAAHLQALLNCSIGDSPIGGQLGIVDFVDIINDFPDAIQTLERSIKSTVERYEPRLRSVSVRAVPSDDPMLLCFEISGRIEQRGQRGLICFRSEMAPTGQVKVK